jgi:threonyl-tRNA synthetase
MDWVPYVAVIGDAEVGSGDLTVTVRSRSSPKKPYKETVKPLELIAMVTSECQGMPCRPLYTPVKLSKKARYI